MQILKPAQAFLIQVDSTRKNSRRGTPSFSKRKPIFAEDILLHNRFTLQDATVQEKKDFALVSANDYVVVYCNHKVPHSPNQIKFIFKVISKLEKRLVLKIFKKMQRGFPLEHIQDLVAEGKLSKEMANCGKQGFKFCKIAFSDVEQLFNFDPLVRNYSSSSWKY